MTDLIKMRFGSHLYGTSTPASDTDLKAVHVPSAEDILMQRVRPVTFRKTKLDGSAKNTADDVDDESYALQKYLALVSEGQTVALDMLFAPDWAWTIKPHPIWLTIIENRSKLLSSRYASFVGYCRQQANKYGIKGSRMATARAIVDLLSDAMDKHGTTAKLCVIADELATFSECHEFAAITEIGVGGDRLIRHLDVCNRKAPYTSTIKLALETYRALFDEYGKRALAAEQNQGIDWKALSHAVRIGRQAVELLDTGYVTFPRPDADHLLAIKTGRLTYAPVSAEIEQLLEDIEAAAARSPLPAMVDHDFIETLILEAHRAAVLE
jgi:hypothetical protein